MIAHDYSKLAFQKAEKALKARKRKETLKLLFLGDEIGQTHLIQNILKTYGQPSSQIQLSQKQLKERQIYVEFLRDFGFGENTHTLQLWEVPQNCSVLDSYFRSSDIVVVAIEMADRESLKILDIVQKLIDERKKSKPFVILLGLKEKKECKDKQVVPRLAFEYLGKLFGSSTIIEPQNKAELRQFMEFLLQQYFHGVTALQQCDAQFPKNPQVNKNVKKIVFLGAPKSGKTCLLTQYLRGQFEEQYNPTIGADTYEKKFFDQLSHKTYLEQYWDCQGQEGFSTLIGAYLIEADVVFYVYDITNHETLKSVERIIDDTSALSKRTNKPAAILVGNKVDLKQERKVSFEEGQQMAFAYGLRFYQLSAKDTQQVKSVIDKVVKDVINNSNSKQQEIMEQKENTKQSHGKVQSKQTQQKKKPQKVSVSEPLADLKLNNLD